MHPVSQRKRKSSFSIKTLQNNGRHDHDDPNERKSECKFGHKSKSGVESEGEDAGQDTFSIHSTKYY